MIAPRDAEADYLPARMVNEFVYCPRLFFYEHVEGVFVDNLETIEGSIGHNRVDGKEDELPPAAELLETSPPARARSVMLSSDTHGVIAKMDVLEVDGDGRVTRSARRMILIGTNCPPMNGPRANRRPANFCRTRRPEKWSRMNRRMHRLAKSPRPVRPPTAPSRSISSTAIAGRRAIP